MLKTLLIAALVGLVVGLLGGLLVAIPAVNNLIPEGWDSMIIGALAGGAAAFAAMRVRKSDSAGE